MKKRIAAFFSCAQVLSLLCACASSERMTRMSGGVLQSYSAPKAQRIRSQKFSRIRQEASGRDALKKEFLNANLVNIWPFYFRNGDYTSVLWPMIDHDPYGFAFRPFYNHEGDDYSILFPLSAWNVNDKSGWCLLSYWNAGNFGIVPLVFCGNQKDEFTEDGYRFITPLYISSWNNNLRGEHKFTEFLLGYYKKNAGYKYDADNKFMIDCLLQKNFNSQTRDKVAKMYPNEKVPGNAEGLKEFMKGKLQNRPYSYWNECYGFFPLFHYDKDLNGDGLNLFGPLFEIENKKHHFEISSLWCLLGDYEKNDRRDDPFSRLIYSWGSEFNSVALLSKYETEFRYENDSKVTAWTNLYRVTEYFSALLSETRFNDNWKSRPFMPQDLESVRKNWKVIYPNEPLPENIKTPNDLKALLDSRYFEAEKSFTINRHDERLFLPLFYHKKSKNQYEWVFPCLLTGYGKENWGNSEDDASVAFGSLPLLSWHRKDKYSDFTTVGSPLAWYRKGKRFERLDRPVFSSNTQWVDHEDSLVSMDENRACLFLYLHSHNIFQIAKKTFDSNDINRLMSSLDVIKSQKKNLDDKREKLLNTKKGLEAFQSDVRLEMLRNQVKLEENRIALEELKEEERKNQKNIDECYALMKKLGVSGDIFGNSNVIKQQIIDKCTELRSCDEYGNGLFFHKEVFENGDGNWMFLLGLAGGEKSGSVEREHILYFLYRYTRDGERSEKLLFPFISIQKDGGNTTESFLWRVWRKEVKNGKTSGYFMFIPFGEK